MFQGAFPYRVDDKGRLKMPAEFVSQLGDTFTITRGLGKPGFLWILPDSEWGPMVERLRGQTLADQRTLPLQRWFIGSAVTTSLDGQGRLAIPPVLRDYAGIQHEVMVVGVGPRIELWARERWDQYEQLMSEELIEELARDAGL